MQHKSIAPERERPDADDVFGNALPQHQAILLAVRRRVGNAGLDGAGGALRQRRAGRKRHRTRLRPGKAEQHREQFLDPRSGQAGDADDRSRLDFEPIDDEVGWSFQIVDAERTDLDLGNLITRIAPVIGSLCASRGRLRRLAQHGGNNRLQLVGRGRDIPRHPSAVAQNHQIVGYLQKLFEKMADVNDADAGVAQAPDDIVQTFHLGDVQRRRRLIENKDARILQERPRDFDQLAIRQRQPIERLLKADIDA